MILRTANIHLRSNHGARGGMGRSADAAVLATGRGCSE